MTITEENSILSAIFNQENGGIYAPHQFSMENRNDENLEKSFNELSQPTMFSTSSIDPNSRIFLDDKISEADRVKLRSRELEAISLAEKNDMKGALSLFNAIILDEPNYASAYNNRCQVHRAMKNYEEALLDASTTIRLTNCPKLLVQAHMQRALIMQFEYKNVTVNAMETSEDIEKLIRQDFLIAAKLGNPTASRFVKMLNPYAALGNAVTKDLLK